MKIRLLVLLPFLLTGCPKLSPPEVCGNGLSTCEPAGVTAVCVDFRSNPNNCGRCGLSCGTNGACVDGACACQQGATFCDGACVFLGADPDHCGFCGTACGASQVCEQGLCKAACEAPTSTQCGRSCVNVADADDHCGTCGNACTAATSCHAGSCRYDVVAACSTNGQVIGVQAGSDQLGPSKAVGFVPIALMPVQDVIAVTDYNEVMSQVSPRTLDTVGPQTPTGSDARFLLSNGPLLYVVNSVTGTLQIFETGGPADGGVALTLLSELPLSASDQGNTFAQGIAQDGSRLYIPLAGGFGSSASEGQKVLIVNAVNPSRPQRVGTIDLSGIDLHAFDGGEALPRPADAVIHRGALYVALNNLDPSYAPAGPGMLAKIDLLTHAISTIDLGADTCLVPVELVSDGSRLFVSCLGKVRYQSVSPYRIEEAERSGLVVLDTSDQKLATWAPACPAGNDGGCIVPVPSRFAVVGNDVYLGDQNGGRMFVLELRESERRLVERRGYNASAGPLDPCPVDPEKQLSNVIDVVAVP